jgi:hypothetical protein
MRNSTIISAAATLAVTILALPLQGAAAGEVPEIVRLYAPVLSFHPKEGGQCCYPSDAEQAFAEGRLGKEVREPKSLIPGTPCYYQTAQGLQQGNLCNVTRIKYWFWYNYNDFPECPDVGGSHPGDWESVEVVLVWGQVYVYLLSNHDGCIAVWPGAAKLAEDADNTHIKVWVGNGSHANYPSPTYKVYCFTSFLGGSCCDEIKDGGSLWATMDSLKAIAETNFAGYPGKWGDPVSPVVRQFENEIPNMAFRESHFYNRDIGDCDVTFGPGCSLGFLHGVAITGSCSGDHPIRFVGVPTAGTLFWGSDSPMNILAPINNVRIRICDGGIILCNGGSIRID